MHDHHSLCCPFSHLLFARIDHLYAIDVIDRIHKEGGSVRAFRSFCGGLPAPESMYILQRVSLLKLILESDSDNPLGICLLINLRGC